MYNGNEQFINVVYVVSRAYITIGTSGKERRVVLP